MRQWLGKSHWDMVFLSYFCPHRTEGLHPLLVAQKSELGWKGKDDSSSGGNVRPVPGAAVRGQGTTTWWECRG